MMFKGHSLHFTWLVLSVILLASTCRQVQAQTGADRVYRVVILVNQTQANAERAKSWLESLGYAPISLDEQGGLYRIAYGNFATQAAAVRAMGTIQNEGIKVREIIAVAPPAPASTPSAEPSVYTVLVREFNTLPEAEDLRTKLQASYSPVIIRQMGRFYQVLVGNYSINEATVTLGQLRQQNYITAKVIALPALTKPAPAAPGAVAQAPLEPASTPVAALPLAITQSEEWRKLSEDDKRKVINSVLIQEEMSQGDPKLANQILDIDKQIKGLTEQVNKIVTDALKAKQDDQKTREEINDLYDVAENQIRSGKYDEAISILNKVLNKDNNNQYGQRAYVQRRINFLKSKLNGESYEGQREDIEKQYQVLLEQAKRLSISSQERELERAKDIWFNIKQLDPNKYGKTADEQIEVLSSKLNVILQAEKNADESRQKQMQYMFAGLGGALVIVVILVLLIWMRGRKRHMELMRKVQEITSIRPMRELEGGGQQLLGEGMASATDSDIFSPRPPAIDAQPGDPLGGIVSSEPAPKGKKDKKFKKGKDKEAEENIPAGVAAGEDMGLSGLSMGSGDDMGFDDIFGSSEPKVAPIASPAEDTTARMSAEPTVQSPAAEVDDIFGNLFAEDKSDGPSEVPAEQHTASVPAGASSMLASVPKDDTLAPISFDEMVAVGSRHEEKPTESSFETSDLLAAFDNSIPSAPETTTDGNGNQGDERFGDSPFASMFGDSTAGPDDSNVSALKEDDTEIPSIKLDAVAETTANPAPLSLSNKPADATADLPAFSFDDLAPLSALDTTDVPSGVELNFEGETVGQMPNGWEGDYPYSTLTVQADTPVKGTHQYICFTKKEGTGKALYTYRFGAVSGLVGIEFDLRCNDKNKFLLGFYVEKDGDFQQSIHTKILRSEAQTTPTIHMQGEPAPYLLGSWTHIKYLVDLKTGKLNGYIDSTHVVRDLPLQQIPDYINTLSIRDNINTTGILLLANIKVYKA